MADPRLTPMRGFTCAVARADAPDAILGTAGIAVGVDAATDDRRYAIALRHADGSVLTAYLSDDLLDRLARRIAGLVTDGDLPLAQLVTIQ